MAQRMIDLNIIDGPWKGKVVRSRSLKTVIHLPVDNGSMRYVARVKVSYIVRGDKTATKTAVEVVWYSEVEKDKEHFIIEVLNEYKVDRILES